LSRSFKKNPGFSDRGKGHNIAKNYANRKVRYSKIVGNYGNYKKLYEQYNIRDYNFRWYSKQEYLNYCKEYYKPIKDNNNLIGCSNTWWPYKHRQVNNDYMIRHFYRGYSK
jgi:hypothetical protein